MMAHSAAIQSLESLSSLFSSVRKETEQLCALLETEDYVVQPAPFVSPPKWHLAHTTWFFDNFILSKDQNCRSNQSFQDINLLFNSYYKSQGIHWSQQNRGNLSRPTVKSILQYRHKVTERTLALISSNELNETEQQLLLLGIHHEKQHQELLLMDIKFILGMTPGCPSYDDCSISTSLLLTDPSPPWLRFEEGLRHIGRNQSGSFCFDNEEPQHRAWMPAFMLNKRLVRNGEFLDFMRDGGYERPEYWLSDGWEWVQQEGINAPLYWQAVEDSDLNFRKSNWFEYQLGGLQPLNSTLPVSHVSYFEADAYARWAGARLPTEEELETAVKDSPLLKPTAFWSTGEKICPTLDRAADLLENGLLWQWSSSPYTPYPGYSREPGAFGEYNGKFMCNQYVLRGGCVATPKDHWRPTYRNFYRPTDRWCFSGIRLAMDVS